MRISDGWNLGYVLDWHVQKSEFLYHNELGKPIFETQRTEIGEAIFQLKYRQDQTKLDILAETMVANIQSVFKTASFVVPIPPSKHRSFQPAIELARRVSIKMGLPFFENILLKKGTTTQIKDIATKAEKIAALSQCFYINDAITNDGSWDVLVIDDLYATGSSLSAAAQTLKNYPKVNNIFVAAFSRTKG